MGGARARAAVDELNLKDKVLSEARILKGLSHRNIIQFHHMLEDDRHLYIVMELAEGGELFDYLCKHAPCTEEVARDIMGQLLRALQVATHSNCHPLLFITLC